jgi:ABC-type Na+ transport system ATPase subunit NatA
MELVIRDLSKTYANGVHALKNVSLTIPQGMFGLLGPNGAGKSTLMRTLATLQEADSGSVTLGTIDVLAQKDELRRTLGYLPQEFGVYPKVSAEDLLDHFAVLKGITNRKERKDTVQALLRQTNLHDVRKKHLGGYSGGMRQRFGIAVALLGNPRLIIVDEPTAGLDPAERVRFLNLLSSRMAIINQGTILQEAEPLRAIDELRGRIWRRIVDRGETPTVEEGQKVISTRMLAGRTVVHVHSEENPGGDFQTVEPTLEDVYFTAMAGLQGGRVASVVETEVLS